MQNNKYKLPKITAYELRIETSDKVDYQYYKTKKAAEKAYREAGAVRKSISTVTGEI